MLALPDLNLIFDPAKREYYAGDYVDSLNTGITFYLLTTFAMMASVKQSFGSPIQCMTPPETPEPWIPYYEDYCFIQHKIIIDSRLPITSFRNDVKNADTLQLVYYQWVPYIFLLQALLFLAPRALWGIMCAQCSIGPDIEAIVAESRSISAKNGEERVKAMQTLAEFVCQSMNMRGKRSLFGRSFAVCYLIKKLFAVLNPVVQFVLICYIIPNKFNFLWGIEIIVFNWARMTESLDPIVGFFPTVVRCDVNHMEANHVNRTTKMQCVLMQNFINEKIFVFIYFWLFILIVVNSVSAFHWAKMVLSSRRRYKYVSSHLLWGINKTDDGEVRDPVDTQWMKNSFAHQALQTDGTLMIHFIHTNAGSIFAHQFAVLLWKAWESPAFNTSQSTSEDQTGVVSQSKKRYSASDMNEKEALDETLPLMKTCSTIVFHETDPSAPTPSKNSELDNTSMRSGRLPTRG